MKLKNLAAGALCVHIGLASPHGRHEKFHKRAEVTLHSTVTDVVTVTDYNAVVWVDHAGNIIKTEYQTPATSTSILFSSSTTLATTTSNTIATSLISTSSATPTASSKLEQPTANSAGKSDDNTLRLKESGSPSPDHHIPVVTSLNVGNAKESEVSTGSNIINTEANIGGFGVAYDACSDTGGSCRSTLDSDFKFLASKGARSIRVYDMCFAEAVNAASAHGLKLMVGITNYENFDSHLNALISGVTSTKAGWSVVDTVFIGNEMSIKGIAPSAIADKVNYGRGILNSKGYHGAVVTVDVWVSIRDNPIICSTSDFCAANAHAYFDGGVAAADAGPFVRMAQASIAAETGGKRVVISESGWPHAGGANKKAIANVESQRAAIGSIVASFSTNPGDIYLFMAYDAKYKTGEEVERNFGIFDAGHYTGTP